MCLALGGRAAEGKIFKKVTTGMETLLSVYDVLIFAITGCSGPYVIIHNVMPSSPFLPCVILF